MLADPLPLSQLRVPQHHPARVQAAHLHQPVREPSAGRRASSQRGCTAPLCLGSLRRRLAPASAFLALSQPPPRSDCVKKTLDAKGLPHISQVRPTALPLLVPSVTQLQASCCAGASAEPCEPPLLLPILQLCLANARDLGATIQWNQEAGIRFFR